LHVKRWPFDDIEEMTVRILGRLAQRKRRVSITAASG
jgi:hypothetical protein